MWDIKHRPLKFADVLGQQGTIHLLKSRLRNGSVLDTSYIFAGAYGMGKTTLARILARAALCSDLDKSDPEPCNACDNCTAILSETPGAFEERDAASGGTIDIVRAMVDDLPFAIMGVPKRVWLWDESHRLSIASQDVLLKPLEEKKVVGIFCTTEAEKIRGPIRSRCEEYTIRKVTRDEILVRMKKVLTIEGVEHEDDAVLTVIDHSGGHVRDVLNKLEMIAQLGGISVSNVRDYLNLGIVSEYYNILLALGDTKKVLDLLEQACEYTGPEEVAAGLAEAAMNSYRLANGMHADFVYIDRALAQAVHTRFGAHVLQLAAFFLRTRYTSKNNLVCSIICLAQNGGKVVETATIPAIVVAAPLVTVAAPPVSSTVSPTETANLQPVVAKSTSVAQPAQQPALIQQHKGSNLRADGIGSLGSGDSLALTNLDDKGGVPEGWPRRSTPVPTTVHGSQQGSTIDDENKGITPDEWRMEFNRTWR